MTGSHRRPDQRRRSLTALALVLALVIGGAAAVRALVRPSPSASPRSAPTTPRAFHTSSPPTSPSSPAATATPSAQAKGSLVIHGTGDVSLDPSYVATYAVHGYGYAWSGLGGVFKRDDLTVVNLECPVSTKGQIIPKQFNFRGDPAALPAMKSAGVDVANMGNNHSYDYGPDALVDTRKNLLANGIAPVGAGRDATEANQPAIFHLNGWTVAVVGLDEVVDPDPAEVATATKPGTADGHDFKAMLAAVRAARKQADLVVVIIHWGVELDMQPEAYQVDQGHQLINAGADVIFGGHSHRLQPLSIYRGKPIFWSLGNFVWPNFSVAGSTTGVAEVTVSPGGSITAHLVPAYIQDAGHPVLRGA
jgi:poly-gamma-glutamate synthesis protein (capsule biosynthesis protein)